MTNQHCTVPATEENLRLEVDPHPLSPSPHNEGTRSLPHHVLVDGLRGHASIGCHGAYSERIVVTLEEDHPDLGRSFSTKHFEFIKPGCVAWGHDGLSFEILKIVD